MGVEHTVSCKMTREGLADEVTFEQRPENQKGSVGMSLWVPQGLVPNGRNSKYKGRSVPGTFQD